MSDRIDLSELSRLSAAATGGETTVNDYARYIRALDAAGLALVRLAEAVVAVRRTEREYERPEHHDSDSFRDAVMAYNAALNEYDAALAPFLPEEKGGGDE